MAKMTFSSEISCAVVAKICQDVGWHTAHKGALTVLADLLENYIRKISSIAVDFANHNDRNDPNVDDLAMTFKFINFDLNQLRDYVLNVNSSPLPQKVPIFPLPCRENRAIDNCAPSDEERPECYEKWMPSLVHKRSSSLPELNYQSAEQSQDVLDKQNATSNISESEAPVFENKSQKNKLVLRFSMSKSVDDLTDENRVHADDEEANEANLSESALIAKRLKKSRAFQNFLNSALYKNPTDPQTKSTLRVADTQRLPNAYQSRENSPQPEPQSIHPNDASNDAFNHVAKNDTKKAKKSKRNKNSVLDNDNLTFGYFNDDPSASTLVKDYELKKVRKSKSSDSTEKKSKKKLNPFSLKMPSIGIADDNANMLDFAEPGPFDLNGEDSLPKTRKQYKPKKEKPPKVLSERKRGRPKKIQSISSTNPTELVFKDGELPLSSSLKTETFQSVFGEDEAAKLLFNLSGSNITGDQACRKRKFDSFDSAGADDSMTDPNVSMSSIKTTPKKVGRPLKRPKIKSSSTKKFVKSAEIIESSGDSTDDDTFIDSNPVSLLPPLPEPSMNFRDGSNSPSARRRSDSVSPMSSNSSLASPFSDFSKRASSSLEHSGSSARHKKAEKHSSKVSTLEYLDQLHDTGKNNRSKQKTKKLSKDKDKDREEKAHKKHKKDKEKLKKSKESREKHKDKEKTLKPKLSFNLGPDFQRTPIDFEDLIAESSKKNHSHHSQSINTSSQISTEHEFPKYLSTENTASDFEKVKKKRGRKKKIQLEERSDSVFITNDAPKVKIISTATSLLDNSNTSIDSASASFSAKHKSRESKTEKEHHRKRDSNAEKLPKKEKKRETKSSKDFKIITETIENKSDDVTTEQWHCPLCGLPDIGNPMIGCDKCDNWFHYNCVGVITAPDKNQKWFCIDCKNQKSKKSDTVSKKGKKSSSIDDSTTITPIPSIEQCSNLPAQLSSSSSTASAHAAKPKVTITASSSGYKPTGRPRGRPRKDQTKPQVTITTSPPPVFLPQQLPHLPYSPSTHYLPHTKSAQKSTKNRVSHSSADQVNLGASSTSDQHRSPSKPTKKQNKKETCSTCKVAIKESVNLIRCDICSQVYHWKCADIYSPHSPDTVWYCVPCKSQPSTSMSLQREIIYEEDDDDYDESDPKYRCGICRLATSTSYDVSQWIACDECDQWYHFECQGITEEPSGQESWFCQKCVERQREISSRMANFNRASNLQ